MKFIVTQEHIDQGLSRKSEFCPVALAIKERGCWAAVSQAMLLIGRSDIDFLIYQTPPEVVDFIDKFDLDKPVEPFEFDVNPNLIKKPKYKELNLVN